MSSAGIKTRTVRRPRRGVRSWLASALIALLGVAFVLPAGLVLVYRFVPPPTTPLILGTWLSGKRVSHRWVPLDQMSAALVKAVIASEDQKFCSHYGFDVEAIGKALDNNARGRRLRGASTISQQTAKNLFLPPNRNWTRKGFEAYFTVLVEAMWPKSRIMEVYLNIVELGRGNFGVGAAAEDYFHKPAARLTAFEAARLAAILPSPQSYSVLKPGPYVARRTGQIVGLARGVTRDRLDSCVTRYGR